MLHGFPGSVKRSTIKTVTGELRPTKDETMDNFQQECKKALWHAFDVLDIQNTGSVHVSQLKVITSSVGMKMGFEKAEEILKDSTSLSMDFQSYFEKVNTELIDKQEHSNETCLGPRLNNVIKTCWALCNFDRNHKSHSFTSDHCMILWRMFNFLSDEDQDGQPEIPVRLDPEEAALVIREFINVSGQRNKEPLVDKFIADNKDVALAFVDFLNAFEKDYVTGLSNKAITQGLQLLYDKYILNVLDKGMIWKRGFKVKSWKERWMVLTPTELKYFVGPDEKILKGSIVFDKECAIEVPADRPTHRPNRFTLETSKKPYDMSAPDVKTKNEWVSGIQQALSRVGKDPNIQKEAAKGRCRARAERRRVAAEEEKKRKEEAALLLQRQNELDEANKKRLEDEEMLRARLSELEEERKRREEAEAKWQEEEALRKAEQERLRQLEEIKRELERLLAEERQAKKDEEIVRSLQAKLLEEEFEKREELEKLKHQQEEMLRAEREQKAVLESDRLEQERLLTEAQAKLDQLEKDREAAAQKMQEATDKLQKAEKDRCILEEKVKLWKKPVGLAKPLQPHVNPHVTHRGLGAFCEKDFFRKSSDSDEQSKSPKSSSGEEDSNVKEAQSEENVQCDEDNEMKAGGETTKSSDTAKTEDSNCDSMLTRSGESQDFQKIEGNDDANNDVVHPEDIPPNVNDINDFVVEHSDIEQPLKPPSPSNEEVFVEQREDNIQEIIHVTDTVTEDTSENSDNKVVETISQDDEIVENTSNVKFDSDVNENVDLNHKTLIDLEIQANETVAS